MTTRHAPAEADSDDLIPTFVSTPADVHLAEQANLESAAMWAFGRRNVTTPERLLTVEFSDQLHHRMFGEVWRSAGRWSSRVTTSGVKARDIEERLDELFDELRRRHDRGAGTPSDRAIRLHHGLLEVCPYRHGNGRHARLMADLYLHLIGAQPITWSEVPDDAIRPRTESAQAVLSAFEKALDQVVRSTPTPRD